MSNQILTVTQLNEHISRIIDLSPALSSVSIIGEISNYKIYPSGHHYFTIKDEASSLKCVMFKSSAVRLKFRPENGMKIIAMGKISVYPRDGVYQLYCTNILLDGVGDLYAAFEQLKTKLAAKGYFDPSHKKPIPQYPSIIGIVTSEAGAAVHDMLRILNKRYPLTKVCLFPVRVQGSEAPAEIAEAIAYANYHKLADLLIVGRGGGSIEDLWAFNDELVAHAIYNSDIPVISAVGHEPDFTISDFVADLRAATPSNAAELAVPDQAALMQSLDTMSDIMKTALTRQLAAARRHLQMLSASTMLQHPTQQFAQRRLHLDNLKKDLFSLQKQNIDIHRKQYINLAAKLDALSPLKVLSRGYAMVLSDDNKLVKSVNQISAGDDIKVSFCDGSCEATIRQVEENEYES